ncbi:MAG TPA: Gfo/Idh/MocA family oxidoreductase [Segetibacter sp.]
MKILLIGLGSIGKRHLRNILFLGYNHVSVVSRSGSLPEEFKGLPVYSSLDAALNTSKFNVAIICTPTSKHIDSLIPVLAAGIQNIYIEKPVSHSIGEVESNLDFSSLTNKNIVVGYDLHFDPGFEKVKQLLKSNTIGKPLSVNAQVGQYLPDWRPYEDYRKGMSARIETGGGVMLDLVHEFDYLYHLFGKAQTIAALYKNSGSLEIETEDVAEVLIQFKSGCLGTIHLDYLQQKLIRNCVITGSAGTINWNLAESTVNWIDSAKKESYFTYKEFERNERFVAIMKAFLQNKQDDRLTSLSDGLESLKMVVAAKKSAEQQQFVSITSLNHLPA